MIYRATFLDSKGQIVERLVEAYSEVDAKCIAARQYNNVNETLQGVKATRNIAPKGQQLIF